jgi:hypothetical protein
MFVFTRQFLPGPRPDRYRARSSQTERSRGWLGDSAPDRILELDVSAAIAYRCLPFSAEGLS